jgi:hypothetical protein
MSIKLINQNPDRYINEGAQWKISASKDIKPIYLPIGIPLTNLKPVIKGNGIVVKIGGDYLCSPQTLNDIKDSNNPHYDIVENGKLKVKDKEVIMGKTIKIIELDITKLQSLIDSRDFQNKQAGVVDVSYINDVDNGVVEGIPKKLIDQINYTLDSSSQRPSDKFEAIDYFKMVDKGVSPHYTVIPIRTITDQQETIFDPSKLQSFIVELDAQLKLLKGDFNKLKETFFNGVIPTPNTYGLIIKDLIAESDVDDDTDAHSVKKTVSSDLVSIEPNPINTIKTQVEKTKQDLEVDIAETNEGVKRRIEEQRVTIEQRIQQGQTSDAQNQNYLANKVAELQRELTKKKDK